MSPMKLLNRILVATDFSAAGRAAVTRASQLAKRHDAQLRIVHVCPDWKLFSRWTSAHRHHYEALIAHAENALSIELARVSEEFGILATQVMRHGKASTMVIAAAAAWQPNLVVAGARGEHQPKISPESLGGTALKLLLHTDYPLLLVRGWDLQPYRITLAAVHDQCETSARVALWASTLVDEGECQLMLAYESPYFERTLACMGAATADECNTAAAAVAHRIVHELKSAAAPAAHVHAHAVRGKPLPALVTAIATWRPTLVVLGRQELGPGVVREPFGTEGFRMAYHCPVDTLVVP